VSIYHKYADYTVSSMKTALQNVQHHNIFSAKNNHEAIKKNGVVLVNKCFYTITH